MFLFHILIQIYLGKVTDTLRQTEKESAETGENFLVKALKLKIKPFLARALLEKKLNKAGELSFHAADRMNHVIFIRYNNYSSTLTERGRAVRRRRRVKGLSELVMWKTSRTFSVGRLVRVRLMHHVLAEEWSREERENVLAALEDVREKTYFCHIHRRLRRAPWLMEFTSVCTDEPLWGETGQVTGCRVVMNI